jgi:tetratricopeptide (TPR) repeat protein
MQKRHNIAFAFLSTLMLLVSATFANGQNELLRNLDACNTVGTVSPDLQINGCTALIASGALSSPGLAVAYNLRGNAYSRLKDYDRAIHDYDDSIRFNPSYSNAFNDRGVAYQKKLDFDRAIENFDEAIRLNGNYAIAFANRAQTYQKKGEFELAVKDYSEVVRLQSQYEQVIRLKPQLQAEWTRTLQIVQNERCWTRAVIGELQAALADCSEALRLYPNTAAIFDSRGFAQLKTGLWDAAIVDYDSALRLQPNLANSLYGRGFARLKKGNARGNDDIDAAMKIDGNIVSDFARYGLR